MPKRVSVSDKIDMSKVRELYMNIRSASGKRSDFMRQAEAMGVKHGTANSMWYRWSKSSPKAADSIVPKALRGSGDELDPVAGVDEKVDAVEPSDVKVVSNVPNEEGSGLRDIYGKMYAEHDEGASNSYVKDSNAVGGEPVTGAAPDSGFTAQGTVPNSINIGKIFYTLGVALNNGLLWKERPIVKGSGEDTWIEQTSNDLNASFNPEDLKREDAPWINWAIAAFGIPALARVDLIPEKVKGLVNWFSNVRGVQQKAKPKYDVSGNATEKETPRQEVVVATDVKRVFNIPETVWDGFSDGAKVWIADLAGKGFKVSPNYVHGPAIDDHAFRDYSILRNQNDTWGNI